MIKGLFSLLEVLILMEYSYKKKTLLEAESTNKPEKPLQSEYIILPLKAFILEIVFNVS